MSTPFIGEVKIVAFNFAPKGWALSNGQILAINQNAALFSLLGTTYGGNGTTTFALPNLQSRVPIHFGQGPGRSAFSQGQMGGEENHTLFSTEMAPHTHTLNGSSNLGSQSTPTNAILGATGDPLYRGSASQFAQLNGGTIGNSGGNQPHTNLQPYLVLNFVIALVGIFPSRN
jgi:microcystin-dependent protein